MNTATSIKPGTAIFFDPMPEVQVTWTPGMKLEHLKLAVVRAADAHYGDRKMAARALGVTRQSIRKWIGPGRRFKEARDEA